MKSFVVYNFNFSFFSLKYKQMTRDTYPEGLVEKIKALEESLDEQIEELVSEYAGITTAKRIKAEMLGEPPVVVPPTSTRNIQNSPQDESDEDASIGSLEDPSRHFKDQCRKIYDLTVGMYREDGIHVLAYCSPPASQTHVHPLKVFNTKLSKRLHERLVDSSIRVAEELRENVNSHAKKKKKRLAKSLRKEPPRKKKRLGSPTNYESSERKQKRKTVCKHSQNNKQTKLDNFFKTG
ncbi:hypothetical protein BY458DRAFT_514181, partial [Sporodiniella umbellata]